MNNDYSIKTKKESKRRSYGNLGEAIDVPPFQKREEIEPNSQEKLSQNSLLDAYVDAYYLQNDEDSQL